MYPFGILRYDDKRVQLKFKFEFKLRRFFCEVDITDDCLSKRLNSLAALAIKSQSYDFPSIHRKVMYDIELPRECRDFAEL